MSKPVKRPAKRGSWTEAVRLKTIREQLARKTEKRRLRELHGAKR